MLVYAVESAGGDAMQEATRLVVRLHDHKGILCVVTRQELSAALQQALCNAWEAIGCESAEDVWFVDFASADWQEILEARRFDSDWVAPA